MTYDFTFYTHRPCCPIRMIHEMWEPLYSHLPYCNSCQSPHFDCVVTHWQKPSQGKKKKFHSVLFFLINITFPQVRIKKKVFVIVVQIQFQIELFFSRAGAFCHMLTFYHWCHLDSFPWQCSDGGLLTHAVREENPYSTTCCLSVWQSSALTT